MALLQAYTGYHSISNNLIRLLALIEHFSINLTCVLPRINDDEIELFNLLNTAYVNHSFNKSYEIPAGKVQILFDRVKELMRVAERKYADYITYLNFKHTVSKIFNSDQGKEDMLKMVSSTIGRNLYMLRQLNQKPK